MFERDKIPLQSLDEFSKSFTIVFSSENIRIVKIVEAIKIKSEKLEINVKFNESNNFLQLFCVVGCLSDHKFVLPTTCKGYYLYHGDRGVAPTV